MNKLAQDNSPGASEIRGKRPILAIVVAAVALGTVVSQTKTTVHPKPASHSVSKPATLGLAFQAMIDMTPAQFSSAGLQKLTDDELISLAGFISQHSAKAADEATKAHMHYRCGPFVTNYDKVKIVVNATDGTPSQIVSAVRQRLRALPDVEIVYSATDADFGVMMLGLENTSASTNHVFGYSVATSTFLGCEASAGETKWPIEISFNRYIFTGPTYESLTEGIVTTIDTNEIESTRKSNAAARKYVTSGK